MGIKFDKDDLLEQINAEKVLQSAFPEIITSINGVRSSLPSLNNKENCIHFIVDILQVLRGTNQIFEEINRILTYEIPIIEQGVRFAIAKELRDNYLCEIDPDIPDEYFDPGINIELRKFDFFRLLKIDKDSSAGSLFYNDIETDLNAFLHDVVQTPETPKNWKDIIIFEYFTEAVVDGVNRPDVMNIKVNSDYNSTNGTGKVSPFLADFVENMTLFSTEVVLPNVYDNLFGTISFAIRKSLDQLIAEEQINQVVQNFMDRNTEIEGLTIDERFFTFDNQQTKTISELANNRLNGFRVLKDCGFVESSIDFDDLVSLTEELRQTPTLSGKKIVVDRIITTFSNQSTEDINDPDKATAAADIIRRMFLELVKVIFKFLIFPQLVLLVLIIERIVSAIALSNNAFDFLKNNKTLTKALVDIIQEKIVNYLMRLALKYLKQLIVDTTRKRLQEKNNNTRLVVLSLLGISLDQLNLPQINL